MKEIKTNLRWAGGKSKMIKILDKYFPQEVNKYLEVFTIKPSRKHTYFSRVMN